MKIFGSLSRDGQLVLRQVEVEIVSVTYPSVGKEAWHGKLHLLPAEKPSTQGHYTLTLSDGRSNLIQLTGGLQSETGSVYHFTGTSP
jgi:hypothetical protein